ncbi:hypothetical protein [uncultured Kordia sp.]|uniref:hypothetical protein n=1 Tax=uncultured Kordia sp. TaxID=507699 RepID=UPI002610009B|nr:hypothetical protein [uncultured Kordia sp.]
MINDRKYIRAYFVKFNWMLFVVILFVSSVITSIANIFFRYVEVLSIMLKIIAIALPLVYVVKYVLGAGMACDDKTYDENYKEDISKMKKVLLKKMNLNTEDILNQFEILAYRKRFNQIRIKEIILGEKPPFILKKKGIDGKKRRTPIVFHNIMCLEDKLVIGITMLDILSGNLLNTKIHNIYFNEITTYYFEDHTHTGRNWLWFLEYFTNSKDESNIVQGSIKEMNISCKFIINTKGGKSIEIILPSEEFIDNVNDTEIHQSSQRDTIMAIQKLLDDKKQEIV